MTIRRFIPVLFTLILSIAIFTACKVSYSFSGAVPMVGVKTFSIDYFPNRAKLVNPNLSQLFTDGLSEKMTRQTSYSQIEEGGDLEFSGQITGYDVKPMNIQQGDIAGQNRLTISIKVKYVNNKDHAQDWEKSFSQYEDFESSGSLSDVEDELVPQIIVKLTDDIFNASIANW